MLFRARKKLTGVYGERCVENMTHIATCSGRSVEADKNIINALVEVNQ